MERTTKGNDKEVTDWMFQARSGQVMMDLETWRGKLEAFIGQQPEIRGKVVVRDLERPATGTAGGNACFLAETDFGEGPSSRRLVVRYQPPKSIFHEYDIPAMFKILKALQGTDVPAPEPFWLDATGDFLGVPAFIMQYVDGTVPPQSYFSEGPVVEATAAERRKLVSNVIETVAKIHAVKWKARGLEFLKDRGRGRTLIERDMSWYWDLLEFAKPTMANQFRPIWDWLVDNQPPLEEPVLNHGDCQLGNYIFRGIKVAAVLDWEMCCLGAREADLAYLCLANQYVGAKLQKLPDGVPPEEEWIAEYEKITGYQIQNWEYYCTMMLFRLTMIFSCGTARIFLPEMLEATRPVWGWFEDRLMERVKKLTSMPSK